MVNEAVRPWKIQPYEDHKREWRWRLKAGNGEIVADSGEGYTTQAECFRSIGRLKQAMLSVVVEHPQSATVLGGLFGLGIR